MFHSKLPLAHPSQMQPTLQAEQRTHRVDHLFRTLHRMYGSRVHDPDYPDLWLVGYQALLTDSAGC